MTTEEAIAIAKKASKAIDLLLSSNEHWKQLAQQLQKELNTLKEEVDARKADNEGQ